MDIRALVAVLFLSATLSGCLTEGKGASGNEDGLVVDDSTPYTQDGIYNCIDHDNLTRCWQVHMPDNLDPNVTVPPSSTCTDTPRTRSSTGSSPPSMT